jgi:fatty-acyl-CoA synthase
MDFGYFLRRLDQGSRVDPDNEAIVFEDERITYRQMKERAYKLANALKSLGLQKGDRVAVLLRNCSEWFDIFFAVASLGAVMVPVNFLLKSKEVAFIVNDSGSSMILVGEDLLSLIDLEKKDTPELREIISIGKETPPSPVISYSKIMNEAEAIPVLDEVHMEDLFILQYTSGTTGFPKGAMHTHSTLLWNSFHQVGDFEVTPKERYLCIPGLCWVAGFHDITLPALWMGGTVVLFPSGGLDVGYLLGLIEKEKITKVLMVPTILKQVVDFPELNKYSLDSLELVATGAEPVPVTVIEKFNQLLPQTTLIQGYGLSEGPSIALFLSREYATRKIGSAGKPVTNCELLVVDDSMKRVPPGEKGEIVIRSPATMIGYWNKPEATEEVFKGGWLHTGDLAEYDEEGFIYITGRKKDMYISGGLNVYPAEIENIILTDSRVAEIAVVGIEDERWGEIGCAIVVPKERMAIPTEELDTLCKKELAGYKRPAKFIIRDEPLPRTASGKIKKFELTQSYHDLKGVERG